MIIYLVSCLYDVENYVFKKELFLEKKIFECSFLKIIFSKKYFLKNIVSLFGVDKTPYMNTCSSEDANKGFEINSSHLVTTEQYTIVFSRCL